MLVKAVTLISLLSVEAFAQINEKLPGGEGFFLNIAQVELRIYASILGIGGAVLGFLIIRLLNNIERRIGQLEAHMSISDVRFSRIEERFNHTPTKEEVQRIFYEVKK